MKYSSCTCKHVQLKANVYESPSQLQGREMGEGSSNLYNYACTPLTLKWETKLFKLEPECGCLTHTSPIAKDMNDKLLELKQYWCPRKVHTLKGVSTKMRSGMQLRDHVA